MTQGVGTVDVASAASAARNAADAMAGLSQEATDRVCAAMAEAGWRAAPRLAELAVTETRYGRIEDKVLKDRYTTWGLWQRIRDEPSVGLIGGDDDDRVYAEPVGVVMAICPVTNPTSTPLFKAISAAKGRNSTVIAPHPRAERCGVEVASILSRAAREAGGPKDLVTCLSPASLEATQELMAHPKVNLILATGGSAMVNAAYRSGKPAYGVGPGNVPVYVDASLADPDAAVVGMLRSKMMDLGTSCSAEQCLVVHRSADEAYRAALGTHGVQFVSDEEADRLAEFCVDEKGRMKGECVGQTAPALAQKCGIKISGDTQLLAVELSRIARDEPFANEVLTSVIGYYVVPDADAGYTACDQLLALGGRGHTVIVWTDDERVVDRFASLPAGRVLWNLPGTWGTAGLLTKIEPSFMIGTGVWSGSISSDNITFRQMIQRKRRLRAVRTPEEFLASMEQGPDTEPVVQQVEASNGGSGGSPRTVSSTQAATSGINAAGGDYDVIPLSPEEEELVEAVVTEMLRGDRL